MSISFQIVVDSPPGMTSPATRSSSSGRRTAAASAPEAARAAAIVKATTFFDDADVIAKVSRGLGEPMVGINLDTLQPEQRYAGRGW